MKTKKHFSIKNFIASYYPSDLSKKGDEIVFLCLDENHTFPEEPVQIHFYMTIAGLKGKCKIKAGSHEFLIKANSISIIPAATWIGMEKNTEAFEAQVIYLIRIFLKKVWLIMKSLMISYLSIPTTHPHFL